MKSEVFELLSGLLKRRSGLVLPKDKAYLLETRLTPIGRKYGFPGLEELARHIRSEMPEEILTQITEIMTTNETSFFRDRRPFDQFSKVVLPGMMQARAGRVRIWNAGCSSGQEPYSLCLSIRESGEAMSGWTFDINGTDISSEMLNKARAGLYTQFEVQRGLPIRTLIRHFRKVEEKWQIDSSLRSMVTFRQHNLLNSAEDLGQFDIVFCRNVLIYFDQATKAQVLDGIADRLADDGILFLGAAETVLGVSNRFVPVPGQRGMYHLAGRTPALAGG